MLIIICLGKAERKITYMYSFKMEEVTKRKKMLVTSMQSIDYIFKGCNVTRSTVIYRCFIIEMMFLLLVSISSQTSHTHSSTQIY